MRQQPRPHPVVGFGESPQRLHRHVDHDPVVVPVGLLRRVVEGALQQRDSRLVLFWRKPLAVGEQELRERPLRAGLGDVGDIVEEAVEVGDEEFGSLGGEALHGVGHAQAHELVVVEVAREELVEGVGVGEDVVDDLDGIAEGVGLSAGESGGVVAHGGRSGELSWTGERAEIVPKA